MADTGREGGSGNFFFGLLSESKQRQRLGRGWLSLGLHNIHSSFGVAQPACMHVAQSVYCPSSESLGGRPPGSTPGGGKARKAGCLVCRRVSCDPGTGRHAFQSQAAASCNHRFGCGCGCGDMTLIHASSTALLIYERRAGFDWCICSCYGLHASHLSGIGGINVSLISECLSIQVYTYSCRVYDCDLFQSLLHINVPHRHSVPFSFSPDGPSGRGQM